MKNSISDNYNKVFKNKNNILVITAHPDDAEINAGGLIARLIQDEKNVRLVVATDGQNGNRQMLTISKKKLINIRYNSQISGAKSLGIDDNQIFNLGIIDGYIENNHNLIKTLVEHIREFKPDIIITHTPDTHFINYRENIFWVNHRDHRNLASTVVDAVYPFSRDANFFPELIKKDLLPFIVSEFLFFEKYGSETELFFDISSQLKVKEKALNNHKKGNILTKKDINVFLSETQIRDKHYERFGHIQIDRLRTIE